MFAPFVLIGLAVLAWGALVFNRLVRLLNQTRAGWADIDVQLARRHDLVPQLVATTRAYAEHERATLEAVTDLRRRASESTGPAQSARVEDQLERAIGRVFALVEAYPELRANERFAQLQRELVDVEDHLQYARRFYNGAVRDYRNAIQRIPDAVIARAFGFEPVEFFEADDDERRNTPVELSP